MRRIALLSLLLGLWVSVPLHAQYFGRNKPRYQDQDFKVSQTEHFEIYEYLNNPEKLKELSAAAELWYSMHQAVLQDSFTTKNPMIIYNDHAGFQQTNAIQGGISVGTGGVTEGLRNRVVFPIALTNQQTNHVLGHELVHAFQYHIILNGDSTNIRNFANLPLWMVEGMAEYLSIGRIDPHTALWMRDAVLNDQLPKRFRDLDSGKYFPYRWGQAFWAFIAGVYGDEAIRPLFENTAKLGLDPAIALTLGISSDSLALAWRDALKNHYGRWAIKGKKEDLPGKLLLSDDNAGKMNICPVLSPNGKYVIFLSEKNLFSIDLFLADAKTGKILKKVASTANDGHIDQFNFLESAGAWSPDDKRFAFDVYEKGRSKLVIKEVFKGKTLDKIEIPGVPSFSNPAWSPDGKTIVVSGLVNGQTDLYAYELKSKKVRRLTNDKYAEILPAWSSDGAQLAFSTDQLSMERARSNGVWAMNLAVLDMASGAVENIDLFPGADNLNPQFDKTGNLLFLSNRDGFRNLYRYDPASKKVYQLTSMMTGITGITPYAPAITVAEDRDRIVYTHYAKGEYLIHQAKSGDFQAKEIDPMQVDMVPASLPPFNPRMRDIVNTNLRLLDNNTKTAVASTTLRAVPYKPKFSLEYVGGSAGVGVMTGNTSFGNSAGVAGGVDMLFRDILGNNQVYAGLALNGEIQDIAGVGSYINTKNRLGWGFSLSHIPYSSYGGYQPPTLRDVVINPGDTLLLYEEILGVDRLFNQRLSGFTFYPFSSTQRIELSASMDLYQQRRTLYYNYYNPANGRLFLQDRQRGPKGLDVSMGSVGAAYVGDNSFFGLTAPLQGWRYRLGVEQYFGYWNFSALLLDGRRYFRMKPVTLALRGLAYQRLGGNANNLEKVFPFFASQPFFVRGYTNNFLYEENPDLADGIIGSKLGVANAEIRLPFTGPRGLSLIPSNFLLSDLNFFFDAGVAFFDYSDLEKPGADEPFRVQHKPLLSAGVSLRINVLGALVIEPYYALPLSVSGDKRRWVFGLNFVPGW